MQETNIRRGFALILSAPSGAGKTTLARWLMNAVSGVRNSVSTTTRAPRGGERDGEHYFFVDQAHFQERIAAGAFLEWAQVFGNYYGTSQAFVEQTLSGGEDVLLDIDWQGARQIRERLHPEDVVSVFVAPPSIEVLKERLMGRGTDHAEVVAGRMAEARDEMSHWNEYDYLLVNDDLARAQAKLEAIVVAERSRRRRAAPALREMLSGFGLTLDGE